jgi:putative hydrolase of HD superfamily
MLSLGMSKITYSSEQFSQLMKFLDVTAAFQRLARMTFVTGSKRRETDAEHSWQLAMLAWFVANQLKLKVDMGRLLQYAIAHDLVEVYAGDTYFYTQDKALKDSKEERELAARERLRQEFPEFSELHAAIDDYEARKYPESVLIYTLDKLISPLNIYQDDGYSWQIDGVTLDMLINGKTEKISKSPEVTAIWNELIAILKTKPELFPKIDRKI